tara:strand:- start:123 stop:488 length:366 start_codon:yes stop_codon:yes gene_type:complete
MLTFKTYVGMHDIKLEFYGGELVGTEDKHRIFLNYIDCKRYSDYIFFSVRQFMDKNHVLQEPIIEKALKKNIVLHFANENRQIREKADIQSIKALAIGINSRKLEKELKHMALPAIYEVYQ